MSYKEQQETAAKQLIEFEAGLKQLYIRKVYVDISGGLIEGALLTQLVYWFTPNERGKLRLRVTQQEMHCLAKQRRDWWEECRLTERQVDRACRELERLGLIATKVFKFKGQPIPHFLLNYAGLMSMVDWVLSGGQRGADPKVPLPFAGWSQDTIIPEAPIDTNTQFDEVELEVDDG